MIKKKSIAWMRLAEHADERGFGSLFLCNELQSYGSFRWAVSVENDIAYEMRDSIKKDIANRIALNEEDASDRGTFGLAYNNPSRVLYCMLMAEVEK